MVYRQVRRGTTHRDVMSAFIFSSSAYWHQCRRAHSDLSFLSFLTFQFVFVSVFALGMPLTTTVSPGLKNNGGFYFILL